MRSLIFSLIGFGVIVRLAQYLPNRSLWADEAVLAVNIVNRSFSELVQPLAHDQAAPIGFLFIEKLLIQLFGNHEYSLRLFPFVCGIVSLVLFYRLAQQFLQPIAVLIALTLFASLDYLVYYASEVKQYSSDVAIAIGCFLLAQQVASPTLSSPTLSSPILSSPILSSPTLSRRQAIGLAGLGSVLIWFSHPAIFTLFGVGVGAILLSLSRKNSLRVGPIVLMFSSWLISFLAFYGVSLSGIRQNESLANFWLSKKAFPTEFFDINWLFRTFVTFFEKPLGFIVPLHILAIVAFIIGSVALFRREKLLLPFLLSPAIATLIAAYLQKYPFQNRLILFLTPFVILIIAEGAASLWQRFRSRLIPSILTFIFLLGLTAYPVLSASSLLIYPQYKEEIKPVMEYVKTHYRSGDVIYVFQRGTGQFRYYADRYGFSSEDYIAGVDDLDEQDGETLSAAERRRYRSDIDKLRGHDRVWVVFSHAHVEAENQFVRSYLDKRGKKLDEFAAKGAFVDLYDLNQRS